MGLRKRSGKSRKGSKRAVTRPDGVTRHEWFKRMEHERQNEIRAMYLFKELARTPGARCANCGQRRIDLQVHHVVTQEELKNIKRKDLLWDRRNGLVLCELCHSRHTSAFQRVTRDKLRVENIDFALEIDHGWYLDRYYPKEGR